MSSPLQFNFYGLKMICTNISEKWNPRLETQDPGPLGGTRDPGIRTQDPIIGFQDPGPQNFQVGPRTRNTRSGTLMNNLLVGKCENCNKSKDILLEN